MVAVVHWTQLNNWIVLLIRESCYFTCIVDFLSDFCLFFFFVHFRATESNLYLSLYAPQYNNHLIDFIFNARHELENVMSLKVLGIDFVSFSAVFS